VAELTSPAVLARTSRGLAALAVELRADASALNTSGYGHTPMMSSSFTPASRIFSLVNYQLTESTAVNSLFLTPPLHLGRRADWAFPKT